MTKKKLPRIIIGYYEDINGRNAIPLKNVKPTKAEILAIIKHHVELIRSVEAMWEMGQSGSWEIRQFPYSHHRIDYYSQFVDKKEIDEIFDEVYKDLKKSK